MEKKNENRPWANTSEDCEYCQNYREKGSNFCAKCGKQLKENPEILDYRSSEK